MSLADFIGKRPLHTLNVAIGSQTIECGVTHGIGRERQWLGDSLLDFALADEDELFSLLRQLSSALQRLQNEGLVPAINQVRVVVADSWLAMVGVPWSKSLKSAEGAESYARSRLQEAGFSSAPDDLLRIDDAPFGVPRLVVAYPTALLSACQAVASHLQARLVSLLPLSAAAWQVMRDSGERRSRALAVLDDELLLVARSGSAASPRLDEVILRARQNESEIPGSDLLGTWQRLTLREPLLASVESVPLLDLRRNAGPVWPAMKPFVAIDFPGAGKARKVSSRLHLAASPSLAGDTLNAMPAVPVNASWRWLMLAGTAFLVGAMGLGAEQANMALGTANAQLDAAANAIQPPPRTVAWSRDEIAQVQTVNTAIRELNMPITAILRALEPPQDIHVAVLSVEMGAAAVGQTFSSVKIVAEAKSSADMPRYVAFVAERKPFSGAYLTRHEIDENNPENPYRFTVEALWSD